MRPYGPVFPDLLVFKEWLDVTHIFLDVTKVHFNISTLYVNSHCILLDLFAIAYRTCRGSLNFRRAPVDRIN